MYQLHVHVSEFTGTWRVYFALSETSPEGRVTPVMSREVWLEPDPDGIDPLADSLQVLERAVRAELRPIR